MSNHDYASAQRQQRQQYYHYGIVGDGPDETIAAYGSSVAMGILEEEQHQQNLKAWTCEICTFHNAESLGRFCSFCGSARFVSCNSNNGEHHGGVYEDIDVGNDEFPNNNYNRYRQNQNVHNENYSAQYHNDDDGANYNYNDHLHQRHHIDGYDDDQSSSDYSNQNHCHHSVDDNNDEEEGRCSDDELGDTIGELSNLPHEQQQPHHSSPTRSPFRRNKRYQDTGGGLEGSFSLLTLVGGTGPSLLDDVPETKEATTGMPSSSNPNNQNRRTSEPLNEKDFQMSFANWSISDNGAWTCSVCTFVNTNALHLTCEVCGGNRPSNKSTMAQECQKQMQHMFETSFRTGQTDFLRRQQEKIEEIEERVISAERYEEISDMQSKMIQHFDEHQPGPPTSRHHHQQQQQEPQQEYEARQQQLQDEYERSQQYIQQLEDVRQKEREEQLKMGAILEMKRRDLGMERTETGHALINPPPYQTNLATSEPAKVRAQERLLSQWKTSWKQKEPDVAAIRQRQQQIFDRLQNGP